MCSCAGGNDNTLCVWDIAGSNIRSDRRSYGGVNRTNTSMSSVGSDETFVDGYGQLGDSGSTLSPLFKFNDHLAAVKAVAWSPHQNGLLASGGGTADRTIRYWNTLTGECLHTVDTGSQVGVLTDVCLLSNLIVILLGVKCRYAILCGRRR